VVSSLRAFPIKILYLFLVFPMRTAFRAHHIPLDLIILIICGEEYKLWSSSLCNFLQHPVTSSLLCANTLLRALYLSCFLPWTWKTKFYTLPNNRYNYIIISTFMILDSRREDKIFWTAWQQAFREFKLLLISWRMQTGAIFTVVPKYFNFASF
jgi:hypothetical protein